MSTVHEPQIIRPRSISWLKIFAAVGVIAVLLLAVVGAITVFGGATDKQNVVPARQNQPNVSDSRVAPNGTTYQSKYEVLQELEALAEQGCNASGGSRERYQKEYEELSDWYLSTGGENYEVYSWETQMETCDGANF